MLPDEDKTKEQLINEAKELRQRVAELEKSEAEHKQVEEKLKESEERFRIASQIASDVVYERDLQTGIATFYGDIDAHLGYDPGGYPRTFEGWREHVHPEDLAWIESKTIDQLEPDVPHSIEYRMRKKDGTYMTWFDQVMVIWDEKTGKPIKFIGAATDITERKQAEEALRESEEKYRSLFELSPIGITILDMKGMITSCNPAVYAEGGYSEGELVGKHFSKIASIRVGDIPRFIKIFASIVRGKVPKPFEVAYHRKDGTTGWTEVQVALIKAHGKKLGVLVLQRDITEGKQAERQLKESESFLNNVIEQSPFSTWISDDKGTNIRQNQACRELFGIKRDEEVIGKYNIFKDEEVRRQGFMPLFEKVFTKGDTVNLVIDYDFKKVKHIKVPGATHKILDATIFPIKDANGRVTNAIIQHKDITERKQMEQKIQQQNEFLNTVLDSLTHPFYVIDANDYTIKLANSAAKLGNLSELPTCYVLTHKRGEPCKGVEHVCPLEEAKKTKKAVVVEHMHYDKDGNVRHLEVHGYPIVDSKGNVIQMIEYCLDITERKDAEEREKELQQELNLTSRLAAIGKLAAGVAHEINNPLTGIMGFSERLLRKSTDETSKPYLESIHDEACRAAKVVENLRTFARRREPKKEYSDINGVVQKALELRAYELKTSNIEVATDLSPTLPKIMVDFQQIQQVFLNIILNAEQAMTEASRGGKLVIKTQPMKGCIRISFTDDGSWIPAEHLDKVFDPFFTTRGEKGGTGLGLSICHGIVTEHSGRIYAKSKPGKGATFFVELPVTTEEIDKDK